MNLGMSLHEGFEKLYNEYISTPKGLALLDIEGISPNKLDVGKVSYDFFEKKLSDIAVDANSNFNEGMNPSSYRSFVEGNQMKLLGYHMLWYYSMKRFGVEFANKAMRLIWNGALYFHDAHGVKIQMPYCYAFSLSPLVYEGRPYGSSPNTPPKHRKSFISQVDKLISDLSKQFAGATAPSDFFLWYAYFCQQEGLNLYDNDDIKSIEQDFQGLVYLFNEPSRAEGESPFTNIAVYDKIGLHNLFGNIMYPNGDKPDLKYIMNLQKIFMNWFSKGNPETGFPFRFPVVTANITTDEHKEFVDKDFAQFVAMVDRKLGNFNIHFGSKAKLAMCCRYENDLDDMGLTPDSFGNGGVNIGSHRVVTLNLPRIAMANCGNIDGFYKILDDTMDVASKLLMVHRYDILQKRIDRNPDYLQFFGKLGWFSLDTMFSTFGITGIHEMTKYMGYDILDDDGTDFTLDVLQHIKSNVKKYRHQYRVVFNTEEIPGEQTCVTLVNKDKLMGYPVDCDLYSNQYIPLTTKADIVDRVELSGRFMEMVSGGGIVHINIDHEIDTWEKVYELMKFSAKSGVPHMAICYRYGRCENGHTLNVGQTQVCPVCGAPLVLTMNRVIGYFSFEQNWGPVRKKHDAQLRYFAGTDTLPKTE